MNRRKLIARLVAVETDRAVVRLPLRPELPTVTEVVHGCFGVVDRHGGGLCRVGFG